MKYFLIIALATALLALPAGPAAARSWWPAAFPQADSPQDHAIRAAAEKIIPLLALPADASATDKADAARHFVETHSVHLIDDEFYSYWADMPRYLTALHWQATAPRPAEKRPHMECATRSAVLYHVLAALGIQARIVVVYHPDHRSHTFLEIYDPQSRKWTIQDPDMGIYWIYAATGERAGIEDLVTDDFPGQFTSCRASGDCGLSVYTQNTLAYYSKASQFAPRGGTGSLNVRVIFNPARYPRENITAYVSHQHMYCALSPHGCRYDVKSVE